MRNTIDHNGKAEWVRTFISDYAWIHIGLGLVGNVAFVVGSVFFLWDATKHAALWLFIIGSAGMLVGSVGSALVKDARKTGNSDG